MPKNDGGFQEAQEVRSFAFGPVMFSAMSVPGNSDLGYGASRCWQVQMQILPSVFVQFNFVYTPNDKHEAKA